MVRVVAVMTHMARMAAVTLMRKFSFEPLTGGAEQYKLRCLTTGLRDVFGRTREHKIPSFRHFTSLDSILHL